MPKCTERENTPTKTAQFTKEIFIAEHFGDNASSHILKEAILRNTKDRSAKVFTMESELFTTILESFSRDTSCKEQKMGMECLSTELRSTSVCI